MTKQDPADSRLSKFSNADRGAFRQQETDRKLEQPPPPPLGDDPPLADLLEHAIRGRGLQEEDQRLDHGGRDGVQGVPGKDVLPERLIEELKTAQEQMWAEPPLSLEEPAAAVLDVRDQAPAALSQLPFESREDEAPAEISQNLIVPAILRPRRQRRRFRAILTKGAEAVAQTSRKISRRMRIRDWRRRRLALLSVMHRKVFDRETEKLLFCKTPPLEVYHVEETEAGVEKSFVYQGPIPKKLLDWALSALPDDVKRYAFVDFRAGNGRTLLLAARHNFEYAAGYAFDAESSETLEMNLAQYPRSYLACRDVRALRGDRDGVHIPSQPAVLFFPDSLSAGHLDIILTYVTASLRLDPRPVYLIFENAGREQTQEQMKFFEKVSLPVFNLAKAILFAPIKIAVYRSKIENQT